MPAAPEIVICGAGIAGISAAYSLAVRQGLQDIVLVDENPPLSLTSDRSSECYRNWWSDGAMLALMQRSIDLLEGLADESGNVFHLNRRGYLYVSGNPEQAPAMQAAAQAIADLGAGPLRIHTGAPGVPVYQPAAAEGFHHSPEGADLLLDSALIQRHFPYLNRETAAALHVRRAGWFSAQQLGMYLLEEARRCGVRFVQSRLTRLELDGGRIAAAHLADGRHLPTRVFINAAGPLCQQVAEMLRLVLPVHNELHLKAVLRDPLGVIDRRAPLLICNDPQILPWTPDERQILAEDPELYWLLERLPPGAHTRPEGGPDSTNILLLWDIHAAAVEPAWPIRPDPQYAEIALRGLSRMLPGLRAYLERMPRPSIDGGYYTRTPDNRPLIGALPIPGAYILSAFSGFGLMAACAAGELLAAHITGAALPTYAPAFALERFDDPAYLERSTQAGVFGQL